MDGAAELTGARYAGLGMSDPGHDGLVEIRKADLGRVERESIAVIDVPILVEGEGQGEEFGRLYLAEQRDGSRFTDDDRQLLNVLNVLAAQAGIAIGNARLYETARQRERWIEGAAAVTTALLTGGAADALLTVADRARILADATAGVILQPTDEGGMEVVTAATLDDPGDGD
ncbi:GAF domain-containing protein, partial [Streptomyces lunaelactis]|nr:GAF domain-containing protein [Streptomyces lunaelactis]